MKIQLTPVLCLIFLFAGNCFQANGQSAPPASKITGKVLDELKKTVLYASIGLLNQKDSSLVKGFLTPEDGSFIFDDIPAGVYLLTVAVMGYEKLFKGPFVIDNSQKAYEMGSLQLSLSTNELENVTITHRKPLIEKRIDKTVLNIENSILAAGNSALQLLERAPGVFVDNDGNISLGGRQGTLVMMDGKPTYLSREELRELLRSTAGNAIQSIELIANPSAKYDAAGNAGIINIKFKKNQNLGTNGSFTAGTGYGSYLKTDAGFSINHRQKHFNIFGNYNFSGNETKADLKISRENDFENGRTYINRMGRAVTKFENNSYKAGLDYSINDKNTIGFVFNGYRNHTNGYERSPNEIRIGNSPSLVDSIITGDNSTVGKYLSSSYNLSYKSLLDTTGRELSLDFDYSRYYSRRENINSNRYKDASGMPYKEPYIFRNETPSLVRVWSGKIDYSLPLAHKMKLDAGLKSSFVSTDNNFRFENAKDGGWLNDPSQSNHFLYKENINAAYLNLNKKFSSTTVQIGLRAEQTNSKGNLIDEGKVVNRHYFNLFPSFFINQNLSENNEVGFSYSRRIGRPDYGSLNPFVEFVDLYTYEQGNPFLNPEYTNSLELSYVYKKTFNMTLGYSRTNEVMTTVLLSDPVHKTLYITNQNLARHTSYNLNVSLPVTITKWWTSDNSTLVFYNDFRSPNLMGAPYRGGKLSFLLNTSQNFEISPTLNAELSGNYMSSQVYGTYSIKPIYGINMGISKSFAKKNGNIKLSATDILNTNENTISSLIPSQVYQLHQKLETKTIRLSLSYRFGSKNVKAPAEKVKSSAEEESRIKKGN